MPSRPRSWPEPPPHHPPVPAWLREGVRIEASEDASFLSGAALATLHPLARDPHPVGRLWRQRLALTCAARAFGRGEDEATLRDHVTLTHRGGDPGPGGRLLLAWRALGTARLDNLHGDAAHTGGMQSAAAHQDAVQLEAARLGDWLDVPADIIAAAWPVARDAEEEGPGTPIAAAAGTVASALRLAPKSPVLALWLADIVLARKLRWPVPVPLLAAHVRRADLQFVSAQNWPMACHLAYARSAVAAIDLHADLRRRARLLLSIAPKLRSKEAEPIVARLLEEDALLPAVLARGGKGGGHPRGGRPPGSQLSRSRLSGGRAGGGDVTAARQTSGVDRQSPAGNEHDGSSGDRPTLDGATGSTQSGGDRPWSERSGRRLFDRLVALGGVRELTGRSSFRIYGL